MDVQLPHIVEPQPVERIGEYEVFRSLLGLQRRARPRRTPRLESETVAELTLQLGF
jgi:hypothetical protein